jgi:hypothetical protein
MSYVAPTVFGRYPNDVVPQRWNYQGMPGWWRVPFGWYVRSNEDGTVTASPNYDFTPPLYDVKTNIDGYMVFQDLGRSTKAGEMSPAQR